MLRKWIIILVLCLPFLGWETAAVGGAIGDEDVSHHELKKPTQELPKGIIQTSKSIGYEDEDEGILGNVTITQKPSELEGSLFGHRVEPGKVYSKKAIFTSLGIFIAVIAMIMVNVVEIAIVGMAGAILMTLVGHCMGFYHPEEALRAIDLGTLGLIFGMMIIAGLLEASGFFELTAFFLAKKFGKRPKLLFIVFGMVTALSAMVINNITIVMVIAPVTVAVSELLGVNPTPYIMAEAMLASVGSTASLVGNPPNMMIGSAAHIGFNNFFIHMFPVAFSAIAITLGMYISIFWQDLKYKGVQTELGNLIETKANRIRINKNKNIVILLACLGTTIILFILEGLIGLEPYFITLIGASLALTLVRPDLRSLFAEVEWSLLLFYTTLFVCVGGLENSGSIHLAAEYISMFTKENMPIAVLAIAWLTALMSMVVENSVLTLALIPVLLHLKHSGVNITPLWWALAMGVSFGGNATPVGATSNIIAIFISKKTKRPISFAQWMKIGMPLTFAIVGAGAGLIVAFIKFYSY